MNTPSTLTLGEQQKITKLSELSEHEKVEDCAFKHAPYSDSYLVTEPDYQRFWDDQKTGLVGYVQHGKYLHVVGGLIAPHHRKEELLAQFCDYLDRNKLVGAFYSISEEDLPLFRSYGFQVSKFGENTTLNIEDLQWKGAEYAWLRRQKSFVARQGIVAREIFIHEMNEAERTKIFEKLEQINQEQLAGRFLSHHINLLEGKLYKDHFYRRRLFVAHEQNQPDAWQAYVACIPMNAGESWATEMYRSSNQSVRGVIPFVLMHAIETMRDEGLKQVSLCMVPAYNCHNKLKGDSWLIRLLLSTWAKHFNFVFSVQGLHHFKTRFRPEFSPAYLCVRSKVTPRSVFSFMQCVGLFKMNWKNLFRKKKK